MACETARACARAIRRVIIHDQLLCMSLGLEMDALKRDYSDSEPEKEDRATLPSEKMQTKKVRVRPTILY